MTDSELRSALALLMHVWETKGQEAAEALLSDIFILVPTKE